MALKWGWNPNHLHPLGAHPPYVGQTLSPGFWGFRNPYIQSTGPQTTGPQNSTKVGGWTNPSKRNALSKLDNFPKFRGEHKEYLELYSIPKIKLYRVSESSPHLNPPFKYPIKVFLFRNHGDNRRAATFNTISEYSKRPWLLGYMLYNIQN